MGTPSKEGQKHETDASIPEQKSEDTIMKQQKDDKGIVSDEKSDLKTTDSVDAEEKASPISLNAKSMSSELTSHGIASESSVINNTGESGISSVTADDSNKGISLSPDKLDATSEVQNQSTAVDPDARDFLQNSQKKDSCADASNEVSDHCKIEELKGTILSDSTTASPMLPEDTTVLDNENSSPSKKARLSIRKPCPKIKISVAKNLKDENSVDNVKNWYISSERKDSTDSVQSLTGSEESSVIAKQGEHITCNESKKHNSEAIQITSHETTVVPPVIPMDSSEDPNNSVVEMLVDENGVDTTDGNGVDAVDVSDNVTHEEENVAAKRLCDSPVVIKQESIDIEEGLPIESLAADVKIALSGIEKTRNEDLICRKQTLTVALSRLPTELSEKNVIKTERIGQEISPELEKNTGGSPKIKAKRKGGTLSSSPGLDITPLPRIRKKNYSPEAVVLPFSMGWMRELVHRANEGKSGKRQSDIYYFTPEGVKLRSMPDITNYLSKQKDSKLSSDNFTFSKELIFREPFEVERSAKQKSVLCTPSPSATKKVSSGINKKQTPTSSTSKKQTPASSTSKKQTPTSSTSKKQTPPSSTPKKNVVASKESKKTTSLNTTPSKDAVTTPSKKLLSPPEKNKVKNKDKVKSLSADLCVELPSNENDESDSNKPRPSRRIIKKVPFDNSFKGKTPIRKSVETRRHSSASNSSNSAVDLENVTHFSVKDKKSVTEKQPKKNCKKQPVPSSSAKDISIIKLGSQTSASLKRQKEKRTYLKTESRIHRPCTPRCVVARVQKPNVKCVVCLCLFHKRCLNAEQLSKGLAFACEPCSWAKSESYKTLRCALSSPTSLQSEEHDTPDLPDDLEISLLFPEVTIHADYSRPAVQIDRTETTVVSSHLTEIPIFPDKTFPFSERNILPNNTSPSSSSVVQKATAAETELQKLASSHMVPTSLAHRAQPNIATYSQGTLSRLPMCYGQRLNRPPPVVPFPPNSRHVQPANVLAPNIVRVCLPMTCSISNARMIYNMNGRRVYAAVCSTSNIESTQPRKPFCKILPKTQLASGENILCNMLNETKSPTADGLSNSNSCCLPSNRNTVICDNALSKDISSNVYNSITSSSEHINSNLSSENSTQNRDFTLNEDHSTSLYYQSSKLSAAAHNNECGRFTKRLKLSDASLPREQNFSRLFMEESDQTKTESASYFCDMNTLLSSYECLNLIFKKLNVCDLLRASQVCRSWKKLAAQNFLWESVSFAGQTITDWDKCCATLKKHGTKILDFRGIQHQNSDTWKGFERGLIRLTGILELLFDKVPPSLVSTVANNMPHLCKLECHFVTTVPTEPEIWGSVCGLELSALRFLGRLEQLKIGSAGGIILNGSSSSLMPYLPNLRHVALTGFKFYSHVNLESLAQQKQLISLELGDCTEVEPGIYRLLGKLRNLKSLRLENGGSISDTELSEALSKMDGLEELELMNYKIDPSLAEALKQLKLLIHLNIWPDTALEGPQVNYNLLHAISSCKNLKYICWGVISEGLSFPKALHLKNASNNDDTIELTIQELFQKLVALFPQSRVDVKCVLRKLWREFCSLRK